MGRRVTRFLASHYRESVDGDKNTSLVDVEFEFLGDGGMPSAASTSSDELCHSNEMELDEDDGVRDSDSKGTEQNKSFWDDQCQLLQGTLCRSSRLESRIRCATKKALTEMQSAETACGCGKQIAISFCRNCLLNEVSRRLQSAGYNGAFCRTKWRASPPHIPSGEHNFLDVVDCSSSKKGEVRVIVELNFRAEFEIVRASEDYNRLVRQLPEVFVGKVERLRNLIKILCMAAKKCMKENKMHMGPWRKHSYMQAKWLGPCERNTSTTLFSVVYSERMMPKPKPKASMLTVDLLDPSMHCTAVEVL